MSDDSDLLIAAAATAAVFTWVGTRRRRSIGTGARYWRAWLRTAGAGLARSWRETPVYLVITGIRDAFFRKK